MTITPKGSTEAVESNGVGLLPEEVNGNPPKLLGTITDNKNSSNKAVYEIAMGYDATPDNVNFNIEDNTLYYLGADTRDFEIAGVKKSFTITIVRYHNEADATAKRSPQIFEYIVNLRDVLPTITGNEGATTTALPYLAMGNVGDGNYKMIFAVVAEGDTLTIKFEHGGSGGLGVVAQYVDNDNPSPETLTGFSIITRSTAFSDIVLALGDKDAGIFIDIDTPEKQGNFQLWYDYVKSVEDIRVQPAAPIASNPIFSSVVTLTGTERGIVIDENIAATTILANFASADTATWSLTGTDKADFNIDNAGNVRFENAPNYETPADANGDNQYRVTINANDGVNTQTFDLLVVVKDVTE